MPILARTLIIALNMRSGYLRKIVGYGEVEGGKLYCKRKGDSVRKFPFQLDDDFMGPSRVICISTDLAPFRPISF